MAVISQETWDNLPKDFKHSIIAEYHARVIEYAKYRMDEDDVIVKHYEYMFGKENMFNES